jgi:hypothetical protein
VLIAKPEALSAAELIFLPVESCSIAELRERSFRIKADCAIDALTLVFTTLIVFPLWKDLTGA